MDNMERGLRLAELRKSAGLLQRQVGAEFDIDKASVSSWEKGLTSPDRKKLARLDEMYDADGEVLRLYDVARGDGSDGTEELLRALRSEQSALARRVEVLAETLDDVLARLDESEQG